jgi:predicted nicotinamide N-methyase
VRIEYQVLDWNDCLDRSHPLCEQPVPLVIGSDLLYERRHIPALVGAIDALCAPGGQAVIADPGRDHLPLFAAAMQATGWHATLHPADDIYVCRFER